MAILKFRGSSFSYEPTNISTPVDSEAVKYRGHEYSAHQAIARTSQTKGLKYRGVTY